MKKKSQRVFLVDGVRTPILKARGKRGPFAAADLAVQAGRALLARSAAPVTAFDEMILGCVMPSEKEANIGRIVALRLGLGDKTPAWTVQRNCASGMQSIDCAINRIRLGEAELVIAGGVEAMSRAPVMYSNAYIDWLSRFAAARSLPSKLQSLLAFRPNFYKPVFALEHGLTDPVVSLNMGQTAEKIAARFAIERLQMDDFAVQSHRRAAQAIEENRFQNEVIPMIDSSGVLYSSDDGVRPDSSVEKLERLSPVFEKPFGRVTAGNSSQISDGAACVILASEKAVEAHGLTPMAELHRVSWAGLDPAEMGLGPVHAVSKLLQQESLSLNDIDYWEINEAFAGQVLACLAAFRSNQYCQEALGLKSALGDIPMDRLNIDGGAVAIGHPVGMSGARIILHLAHVLKRTESRLGIATLCIGGGQGGATLIERV